MARAKTARAVKPKPKHDPEEERRLRHEVPKELCTRSFHEFVKQAWHVIEPEQRFVDNWHIKAICDHLEATTAGLIPQLLINVPPGTMKSILTSVMWPAWVWGPKGQPGKRFMFSSYAETLSMRDSVRTRDLICSQWYQERWPLGLKEDQNAKGRFDNDRGGWRMIGSITGKGIGEHPDFNVADDPHNVLQAESDADRETVTRWFEGVFCVRGEVRDVKRVLVMQRLHALDCSGVALEKGGWVHLCLPMRFEPPEMVDQPDGSKKLTPRMVKTPIGFDDPRREVGELLWPAKYPDRKVSNLEVNMGLYGSAGQLQQRPAPRGGAKFKRVWFEILPTAPVLIDLVRYWDKAGTRGGRGAQSCGVLMGKFIDGGAALPSLREKFIVLDVITCREEAAEREAIIKQTAVADRERWGSVSVWVEQEPGSGGKESAQSTVGNLVGFACYFERVTGDKVVRAEPLASQASVSKVKLLRAKWNSEFLTQIEQFPAGKLKDMVDGSSGAFNKLYTGTGAFSGGDLTGTPSGTPPDQGVEDFFDQHQAQATEGRGDDFFT